jgi:uncharacterized protein (DUF1330 family)
MLTYVISEVKIIDETAADRYRELAARSIAEYGGKYLIRGAQGDVVEGAPTDFRLVIVEFPSMERARAWYASSEYAEALKFRDRALERRLRFVEGI